MNTIEELRELVASVRYYVDGLQYRGKSANATAEDEARESAYLEVDPALTELEAALPALLDRLERAEAVVGLLRETLGRAEEYLPVAPERNCSCHRSPPCSDCVDYSDLRDLHETICPLIATQEARQDD